MPDGNTFRFADTLLLALTIILLLISSQVNSADEPSNAHITLSDGVTIESFLFQPVHQVGNVPAVVILHGFNGSAPDISDSAELLKLHGFAALTISMRGWGGSEGADDCGKLQGADLTEVVSWLGSQPGIDADRIGALGYSQGGQVALLGAAISKNIHSVVAFFPVTDVQRWGETTRHDGVRQYVDAVCSEDFTTRSPITIADEISAPTLFVHGGRDSRVPIEQSMLMQRAIVQAGGEAKLHLVPGAMHLLEDSQWPGAWKAAVDHLNATLRAGQPTIAEVRDFGSIIPGENDDIEVYATAFPRLPILSLAYVSDVPTETVHLTPTCSTCGVEFLDSLRANAGRQNYVISMSPKTDPEIDIISLLFCGAPSDIFQNIVQYFDAVARSDFADGASSEREILEFYTELAERATKLGPESAQQCKSNPEFRANTASAGVLDSQQDRTPPSEFTEYAPLIQDRVNLNLMNGGAGVGPTIKALSVDELQLLELQVEQGLRDMRRRDRIRLAADVAYLAAQGLDTFAGLAAGVVPGGGFVYSGAKLITYRLAGQDEKADAAFISMGTAMLGPVGKPYDIWVDYVELEETMDTIVNNPEFLRLPD